MGKAHDDSPDKNNLIVQALSSYTFVQAAYLFGSRVRNRAPGNSDVDLALVRIKAVLGWERLEMEKSLIIIE